MIDLTLDEILIPDITGYINPYDFGTKIQYTETNKGGLSTREVNHNILAPFDKMRGVEITQSDYTSEVQYDAKLFINASDAIDLTLGNAQYAGCKVTIVNPTAFTHNLLCTSVSESNGKLLPNSEVEVIWNGTAWQNFSAPAKGKRIIQYPQEKAPALIYPCTSWQEIDFAGAFFRNHKNGVSGNFSEKGQTLYKQNNSVNKNGLGFSGNTVSLNNNDATWSISNAAVSPHSHGGSIYNCEYPFTGDAWSYESFRALALDNTPGVEWVYEATTQHRYTPNVYLSGTHSHYITPTGTISSTSSDTRPVNYTIKIWERVA